tara:strand:- start:2340 stop:2918 length:579 start_codon:yes stop_codon:yes gene_type:complete
MTDLDLKTITQPKSDQLNADDLIGAPMTVTVNAVKGGSREQPIIIHFDGDNGRPYKPCKGMIRVLMSLWGDKSSAWIGRSMTLYNDPTVKWAGVEIGGIRISHVSGIDQAVSCPVTVSKGSRKLYPVKPLKIAPPAMYPPDQFTEKLPAMLGQIAAKKMTPAQVIAQCEKTGKLTNEQKAQINAPQPQEAAE